MNTFDKIYHEVSKIPQGKVTTYGSIAKLLGINNPRVVGYALHVNKDSFRVPCHRVVNIKGEMAPGYAFGGSDRQRKILLAEGVKFLNEKVDMSLHFIDLSHKKTH